MSRNPAREPTTGQVGRWLLRATRPVLTPLYASTLARILDQLLGCALYGIGASALAHMAFTSSADAGPLSLPGLLALMVVLCLVKGLTHYAEQFLGHFVAFKALELLRRACFVRLIPASPAALASQRSGDLLARLTTDIDRIEVFFAHTLAPAISAIVVPTVVCVGIGIVAAPLAGAVAFAIVCTTLALVLLAGRSVAAAASAGGLGSKGEVAQELADSVQGVAEVVGYGLASARLTSLRQAQVRVAHDESRIATLLAARRALAQVGMLVFVVLPTLVAVGQGAQPWVVAALAVVAWRSWDVVRGVEDFSTALANSLAAARRVYSLVHTPPAVSDGPDTLVLPRAPELMWDGVTFTYPATPGRARGDAVLRRVHASAPAGKWTAIVGATGAGKSTLLALALRYWDPDEGTVRLDGRDIRAFSVDSLRSALAVVDQNPHLFTGTIASNLRLQAPEASDAQLWAALEAAQLADDVRALGGLDARVGERAATLSGGQAQRLALARAFLREASLVILDEFTSHLDADLAQRVRRSVREIFPDATILEVTHTPPAEALRHRADGIDRLLVVADGDVHLADSSSSL